MTIQVNLEVQEVQFVLNSIAEQPFKQVADLWFKIKAQAEQQVAAKQAPEADVPAVEPAAPAPSDPAQA